MAGGAGPEARDRRRARHRRRLGRPRGVPPPQLPDPGPLPGRLDRDRGALLRPRRDRARLRVPRRLPDRADARLADRRPAGGRSSPSTRASAGSPRSRSSSCSGCSSSRASSGTSRGEGLLHLGDPDVRRRGPLAALVASLPERFSLRERLMLGWAGLRGAIPIWLATFPVVAGSRQRGDLQHHLLRRRHLDPDPGHHASRGSPSASASRPASRRSRSRSSRSGRSDRLGGEVFAYRVEPDAAIVGQAGARPRPAAPGDRQRDRPRRRGDPARAAPPRSRPGTSCTSSCGRRCATRSRSWSGRWREGPARPAAAPADAPARLSADLQRAGPWTADDGDPARPQEVGGDRGRPAPPHPPRQRRARW